MPPAFFLCYRIEQIQKSNNTKVTDYTTYLNCSVTILVITLELLEAGLCWAELSQSNCFPVSRLCASCSLAYRHLSGRNCPVWATSNCSTFLTNSLHHILQPLHWRPTGLHAQPSPVLPLDEWLQGYRQLQCHRKVCWWHDHHDNEMAFTLMSAKQMSWQSNPVVYFVLDFACLNILFCWGHIFWISPWRWWVHNWHYY